ncbi:uncharacterized protein G2W53_022910 [Senna tora]|uniref:Uncharacterized protein n=1 Tax=Senna tora TaxID=362788 RepID=A0A834WMJ6_9FABA|nr:uncharacterized protein G2W53_022910 [Senna tora]
MNILQIPESMNAPELQVWDNAAFDTEEPSTKTSWTTSSSLLNHHHHHHRRRHILHPVFETETRSDSMEDSDRSKENLSPMILNSSPVSVKSSVPIIKPLPSNGVLGNYSQRKPRNGGSKDDERKIDDEIEEIENEIRRLSSRLETLRLEKIERNAKAMAAERRGRIVPAKFMEAKQSVNNKKTTEEEPPPPQSKVNRRGVSLGPSEIVAGARFRPPGKLAEMTPVQAMQSRRKSCFWKLQEMEEAKSIVERRKSMTVSPKGRKSVSKMEGQKKIAATTVGSKKQMMMMKKESSSSSSSSSGVLSLIQPRKLFRDGEKEKSVGTKKPLKPGRVVASRYNQSSVNSSAAASEAARKRSLPEKEKEEEEEEEGGKKSRGNVNELGREISGGGGGGRRKKRWEIPNSEIVIMEEEKPLNLLDLLPKIKTTRFVDESPRGSGPAKRVADLNKNKKSRSYFCTTPHEEDEDDAFHGEALDFAEEGGNGDR